MLYKAMNLRVKQRHATTRAAEMPGKYDGQGSASSFGEQGSSLAPFMTLRIALSIRDLICGCVLPGRSIAVDEFLFIILHINS